MKLREKIAITVSALALAAACGCAKSTRQPEGVDHAAADEQAGSDLQAEIAQILAQPSEDEAAQEKPEQGLVLYEGEWIAPEERDRREKEAEAAAMRAEGLVEYDGKWVTPEQAEKLKQRDYEDKMRARGLVEHEGKWVARRERDRLVNEAVAAEMAAKGMVLHAGKWVTPEQRDRLVAAAQAEEMKAKGLALHEGEWVTPEQRAQRVKAAEAEEMKAKGLVELEDRWVTPEVRDQLTNKKLVAEMTAKGLILFDGKWVKPEERDALIAQREAAQQARLMAEQTALQRRRVTAELAAGEAAVVVDAGDGPVVWAGEEWAAPIEVSVAPHGLQTQYVTVELGKPDGKDKWVVSDPQSADLTAYDTLVADFACEKPVKVALAVWTNPGFELYEGFPQVVKAGEQKDVTFKLKAKTFKCKATDWQHTSAVQNAGTTYKLSFFIYPPAQGTVRFRNVRVVKGE